MWQNDIGEGQLTGLSVWSDPPANPCVLYRRAATVGVSNQGMPQPQWKLGMFVSGRLRAEFICERLVLAGTTDLLTGQGTSWTRTSMHPVEQQ